MRLKKLLVGSVLALLVAGTLYVAAPLYLAALGNFLIKSDPVTKADAIIVLNGDNRRDERLLHAIQLWHKGVAPRVLLSVFFDDWQTAEDYAPWRHAMKRNLIPRDALVVVNIPGDSTKEESVLLRSYVLAHGYHAVVIVSSSYHTRRVKRVYAREWAKTGPQFSVSASSDFQFHPDSWWTRRTDSRVFFLEFTKTLWYAVAE
jgi:uncharacterized SAM-binding protein YcdF (DUF218 family)